ncbi:MAG: radical SAM protein [Acidobacteria bacterium]|nr:radical SAM protein [Acidobacteriota bacterium]
MQPSMFNVQVPVAERNEVFLMNTLSDAQLLVSSDVTGLLSSISERISMGDSAFNDEERETIEALVENGFLVGTREEERGALKQYFTNMVEDTDQLRITVLTTLQCNFACDYCFQGDHGDHNKFAHKMSLETAARVIDWAEHRLDEVKPEKFVLTLFGGEPLLNLPACYMLAERCHALCEERGVKLLVNIITNGLLLTEEVVDRLTPFGLNGIKITLDGDRDTHNRMRPLRGKQGTFDRIIENVRKVAGKVAITIGGNFDESSVDSYPALLDYLRAQDFADDIAKINFKPIIKPAPPATPKGFIPLSVVGSNGNPLGGACMTTAGAGGGGASACDSCHFVDEKMQFLRDETRKHGFATPDGVHMGPCEIHRRHAYSIGPDGDLYNCPGFTGDASQSTGHIDGREETWRAAVAERFDRLTAHKEECGDCSFVPVCGGGCSVAAHTELGDMHQPSCHKGAFESALVSLAERTAATM